MTRLIPAKPRPSDEAPDALEWQDVVLGVGVWAILTALACWVVAAV